MDINTEAHAVEANVLAEIEALKAQAEKVEHDIETKFVSVDHAEPTEAEKLN